MGRICRIVLAVSLAVLAAAPGAGAAETGKSASSLVLLGTAGGPVLRATRSQPASLLVVGDTAYLIDAGDGAAAQIIRSGHQLPQVRAVFLTHQHQDHTAGLGALIASNWSVVRQTPLAIFGPTGTVKLVESALAYFSVSERTFGRESATAATMSGIPKPTEVRGSGPVYEDDRIRVIAAENSHYATVCQVAADCPDLKSFAYRIEIKRAGKPLSVVFTGDTGPSDSVARLALEADVLVSEVIDLPSTITFLKDYVRLPEASLKAMVAHMEQEHLTPEQVAALANASHARKVVLTHIVWGNQEKAPDIVKLVAGVAGLYRGPVVAGEDLLVVPLE